MNDYVAQCSAGCQESELLGGPELTCCCVGYRGRVGVAKYFKTVIIIREYGVIMRSVASVCVSVVLLGLLTSESLDLQTLFLVCRYTFRISRSNSYVNVIGSRSRSHEKKVKRAKLNIHIRGWSTSSERRSCVVTAIFYANFQMHAY